jgi:tetratricopeptide (TPR) repeat protein
MFLPVAVAALSVDTAMRFRGSVDEPVAYVLSMAGMLATVALGATVLTRAYPVNEEMWTFRELASVRYPRDGMYRQALELFDHIEQNPGLVDEDLSFYEAVVLMKIGSRREARAVLARILDEQEGRRRQWPDDPEAFREAAKVYAVLDRPDRARRHFEIAVKLDERRLEQARDPDAEFKVRRSLAKTLLAMGKAEAAEAQVARAIEIAPDAYSEMLMRHWIAREERRGAFMR